MGNKQSEKFQWERKFTILEKNFNDNTLVLQKIQGGEEYIGREIISMDQKQSLEIKRLVQLKYNKNNPFLTKLVQIYYNNDEGYCSPEDKIYLVFKKPKQTLRQEILARKFANEPFTQQEADIILESGCKAIRSLKQLSHPHNNVSTSSVFIDEDRKILLGDPWITPPIYSQDINQNVFACPSPQKILLQNDQIMNICPYRSDLFSLGTVVLQVLNFEHMDILYEKGFRRLIESKVKEKLSKIKSEQLRYKLSIVLSHDPTNRDEIYKLYRTSDYSASHIKNKLIKEINPMPYSQQHDKSFEKKNQTFNPGKERQIIPIVEENKHKPKIPPLPSYNQNFTIPNHQQTATLPKTNIQANYANNYQNNISTYSPMPVTLTYKPSTAFNQTTNRIETTTNISRPYSQTTLNNNYSNYGNYGMANYLPGSINGTYPLTPYTPNISTTPPLTSNFTTNFPTKLQSEYKPEYKAEFKPEYKPQYKSPDYKLPEYKTEYKADYKSSAPITLPEYTPKTFLPLSEIKAENYGVLTESNLQNNFEATIIKSTDEFVKTSGNLKYVQKKDGAIRQQAQNIQHIGNYGMKTTLDPPGPITKTTPIGSFQVGSSKSSFNQSNINRKTSDNTDKIIIDGTNANEVQNQVNKYINQAKETPERRPNRKYNSTIKEEPEENSYSGSRDGDEEYQHVVEQYQTGRYEGQKKNGMRNGFGKFIYNEGSVYEGHWRDNLMHGNGSLYYSNGKLAYEGDWRMDQFHGFGKVYNSDQLPIKGCYDYTNFSNVNDYWASYEGQLNSDRRHGSGKIKFSNGQIFSGTFVADVVEGEGKFYTLNGQIIKGLWKNNKLSKKF